MDLMLLLPALTFFTLGGAAAGLWISRRDTDIEPPGRRPATWLLGLVLATLPLALVPFSSRFFLTLTAVALLTFCFVPGLLVLIALTQRRRPRTATAWLGVAVMIAAVGLWSFGVEPRRLEVTRLDITSPKLDRPVRLAVVADLQTDHIGRYERRALEAVMDAAPDIVLLTGDYLQAGPSARRRLVPKLRETMLAVGFAAPLGVYAVGGDVEQYADWPRIFDGTGVTVLEEVTSLDAGPIRLTALPLEESRHGGTSITTDERFHVIFGHAPDFALGRPPADLMVAGHTHGGQVRLPFLGPVVTLSKVPRSWAAGVTDTGAGTLVVSRGVGMERGNAPRLRFLCRPEVVIIDLQPAEAP